MAKIAEVSPLTETEPVGSMGDAADDPAIWIHPTDPSLSLIIGTDKKSGLYVYDLYGKVRQFLPDGRMNNVDVRDEFIFGEKLVSIVAATNRTTDKIALYWLDINTRQLKAFSNEVDTGMEDPYGLCLYQSAGDGKMYVFVNDKNGLVRQWSLQTIRDNEIQGKLVREFSLSSQTEGCVVDEVMGRLYIGEENVGIWKYDANPDSKNAPVLIDSTGPGGNLIADVEGLALYVKLDGTGYIIASSQGNSSFVVYQSGPDNTYVGTFQVVANEKNGVDGVSNTDGLDVTSSALGKEYSQGLLVVQDDDNTHPQAQQNFKLIPWVTIEKAIGLQ